MFNQKGIAHLVLIAAFGLILFILITKVMSFEDKLFSSLFPKPPALAATPSTIKIYALGTQSGGQYPQVSLFIDYNLKFAFTADGNLNEFTYIHPTSVTADQVQVAFLNDDYDLSTGYDRNLKIDRINIDGVDYQTEDQFIYSEGSAPNGSCEPGFKQSEWLHCNGFFAYNSQSNPQIDTLAYFLTDHPDKGLTGAHPFSQSVEGQKSYYVKWSPTDYEIHTWDNDYIYLKEDHSNSPRPPYPGSTYTFSKGSWMKRQMRVGEKIVSSDNMITWYNSTPTCQVVMTEAFPVETTLESRIRDFDIGGDLGKQDVIVLTYNWGSGYEKFYYSKEWGWIMWEDYSLNGQLKNKSIFNQITTPTLPDKTSACTL